MHIGERIKARRVELGWSQRELAERMGYKNHSVVARVEAGKVDLPQSRLDQFAKVLGLSHGYLLGLISKDESKKNDQLAMLIVRLRKDPDFFEAVSSMADLPTAEYESIKSLLTALGKK
jgi:transcriptional regulator with XRE-family HTH domain